MRRNVGMTKEEKRMNKRQLSAYKNYDHVSFSMIPGLQNSKELDSYRSHGPRHYQNSSFDNIRMANEKRLGF